MKTQPSGRIVAPESVRDAPLHVVLVEPEIPPNTGNVARLCAATGCALHLVEPLGFRIDDRELKRAGLDYWEHLEWEVVDDWSALTSRLPAREPYFFTKTASRPYTDVHFVSGDVLVFGSESQGLPASLLERHRERALRVPIRPQVRSLNLSNTVAIAVFEALRQFQSAGDST